MSNDSKLWMWRGIVLLCLMVDAWLLTKLAIEAINLSDPNATTHLPLWAGLFFVATLANIPVYICYVRARNNRWNASEHKEQSQIDVEALAAYAKQEQAEKDAIRHHMPPQNEQKR